MRRLKWHAYPVIGGHVIVVKLNRWTGTCHGLPTGQDPWPLIKAMTDEMREAT